VMRFATQKRILRRSHFWYIPTKPAQPKHLMQFR
jgi:hypothetical protein